MRQPRAARRRGGQWALAVLLLAPPAFAHGSGWAMAQLFLGPLDVLVAVLGALVVLRGKLGFAGVPRMGKVLVAVALLIGQALLWLTPARYFLAPPLIAFGATPLPLLLVWARGGRWVRLARAWR